MPASWARPGRHRRRDRLPASPALDLLQGDKRRARHLRGVGLCLRLQPARHQSRRNRLDRPARDGDAQAPALNGKAGIPTWKFQNSSYAAARHGVGAEADRQLERDHGRAPFRTTLSRTTVELEQSQDQQLRQTAARPSRLATNNAQLDADLLKIAESLRRAAEHVGHGGITSSKAAVDAEPRRRESRAMNRAVRANSPARASADDGRGQTDRVGNATSPSRATVFMTISRRRPRRQVKRLLSVRISITRRPRFDLKANQLTVAEIQQAIGSGSPRQRPPNHLEPARPLRADGNVFIGKLILDLITATDAEQGNDGQSDHHAQSASPEALRRRVSGLGPARSPNAQAPEFALAGTSTGWTSINSSRTPARRAPSTAAPTARSICVMKEVLRRHGQIARRQGLHRDQ